MGRGILKEYGQNCIILKSNPRLNSWIYVECILIKTPVHKHHQCMASELPGQSRSCVQVKVSSCRVRKQEDLRGLLVCWRLDQGGVTVNVCLEVETSTVPLEIFLALL